MNILLERIAANSDIIIFVLIIGWLVTAIISIASLLGNRKLRKKYKSFFTSKEGDINIEELLQAYLEEVRLIGREHSLIQNRFNNFDKRLSLCVQKVGIIRYNPFEEMGGNLCFAIALLDEKDNGVVINGIHSRSGSYTYGKNIVAGESEITLSNEEREALAEAKGKFNKVSKS